MQFNKDESPLVSIGVPVYNGGEHLKDCLNSILNQTYSNWECNIINNRSTDETLQIAKSFENTDKRFKVITNPEFVDMTTNFNNTLKSISQNAVYFKVVCADDWVFPEYLEKMVRLMQQYPNAGICSSYRIDNKSVGCQGLDINYGPCYKGRKLLYEHLTYKLDVTGSETTVLYRIDTLRKLKDYPVIFGYGNYHFDTSLAFELMSISDLCFVFQVLSYTRRHAATYTAKYADKFGTSLNHREKELFKYLNIFPELKSEYKIVRAKYGYYLLIAHFKRNKDYIDWHKNHFDKERFFHFREYIYSFFKYTGYKITNKIKSYTT